MADAASGTESTRSSAADAVDWEHEIAVALTSRCGHRASGVSEPAGEHPRRSVEVDLFASPSTHVRQLQ